MFDRTDNRPPPADFRYPQSTDELAPGAIFAAILAAFLVIGVVVYSILSMSQPPQANTHPPGTTGRGEAPPILPVLQPPANPKTIPPIRPLEVPLVPSVR